MQSGSDEALIELLLHFGARTASLESITGYCRHGQAQWQGPCTPRLDYSQLGRDRERGFALLGITKTDPPVHALGILDGAGRSRRPVGVRFTPGAPRLLRSNEMRPWAKNGGRLMLIVDFN
jgi:hypothetical protein